MKKPISRLKRSPVKRPSPAGQPPLGLAVSRKGRKGTALLLVLPLIAVLALVSARLLSWMQTEVRINDRHILRQQALIAAESALEYGAAQLAWRFEHSAGVPNDDLMASNNPLVLPPSITTHFADSRVLSNELFLQGGLVPPGKWMFIENTPGNEFDPLKGRYAFVREIEIYARGVAQNPGSQIRNPVKAYAREVFQVRDAPLFGHAIFYNSTLEINPGEDLQINGPVHANGDIYIGAKSSADLRIYSSLTSAGSIFHDEIRHVHLHDGSNVLLATSSGLESMKLGHGVLDSTHASWESLSKQRWDGNVMDARTGASAYNPVAIGDYAQDDYTTPGDETTNAAYAIIEPLLGSANPDRKGDAVRGQKMEAQAGLVLKVEYDAAKLPSDPGYYVVRAYRLNRTEATNPNSAIAWDANGEAVYQAVALPSGIVGNPNNAFNAIEEDGVFEPYRDTETRTGYRTVYENCRQVRYWWGTRTECDESYEPYEYEVDVPVYGGLYDHREDLGIHTVALDVQALKQAVEAKNPAVFGNTYDVEKDWNGVVYVEFPTSNTEDGSGRFAEGTSAGRNSYGIVAGANPNLALLLIDGSRVPNPEGMKNWAGQTGFTVATNAPLYVVGNYNADGIPHTNDSTVPDSSAEVPAALIADTVTILSNEWRNNRAYSDLDGRSNVQSRRDVSNFVEIAAAIVSGTANTVPAYGAPYGDAARPLSLGVVNLPRFLESWTNETLTIRGSLVSLFESEVRPRGAPTDFNDFYLPPDRDWGFSNLFAQGGFPPGSPVVRSYRRLLYEEIDEDAFTVAVTAMGGNP
jgi:hypothetical protein